jgi:TPP-dependent pyruvate/acetoin dehydrogenase alpha subunit
MAVRMRGGSEVALVYFGDGATSEGDFHVAMNFAGVYKAPVIFLCRNNQWAISTPIASQTASEDLAVKASAYGIKGIRVDGNDLFAVCAVVRRAADQARAGGGPTLIEATTYRLGSHSTSDDPTVYREEEAVEAWRRLDPLTRLRLYLSAQGRWDDVQEAALEEGIRREIQEALRRVERIGPPAPETLFDDVYEELPWNLREQREELLRLL